MNKENKYYVYQLIDPRDSSIFYVGKGCGDRIQHHVRDALNGRVGNAQKHKRIRAIHEAGLCVSEFIAIDNLSEEQALKYEREMIRAMRYSGITNIVNGVVTNHEKAQEMARELIKKTKPFDLWVATISDYRKNAVIAASGSLWGFYKERMDFLNTIAGLANES